MKVLVINAGSSSLKYQLIDMDTEKAVARGGVERIGLKGACLRHKTDGGETVIEKPMPGHKTALMLVLETLIDEKIGVIKSMDEIGAVGHRMVHSGEDFNKAVLLNDEVLAVCEKNAELAPLHMPANLAGVYACREVMKNTPMAAVFDTAFHSNMPDYAFTYAIPYEDYEKYKIRRYGFHGTSHKYVSGEAARFLNRDIGSLKTVTCHLGNGSSISAVDGGKSIDTSMGFTPLEGLPMGTRSGNIDPEVIRFLSQKKGMTLEEVLNYLNKYSGVAGVSGVSSDFRDLLAAADEGNYRAKLALDIFCYRCKSYIGSYAAAMGGLDCIVFTAGIGENNYQVRAAALCGLEFLGVKFDENKNAQKNDGTIHDITADGGTVKVLVIPTNEELVIARETKELVM